MLRLPLGELAICKVGLSVKVGGFFYRLQVACVSLRFDNSFLLCPMKSDESPNGAEGLCYFAWCFICRRPFTTTNYDIMPLSLTEKEVFLMSTLHITTKHGKRTFHHVSRVCLADSERANFTLADIYLSGKGLKIIHDGGVVTFVDTRELIGYSISSDT